MISGMVIALTAVAFALAGWTIYPRLLSRSRMLRTSPVQLFLQSLAAAAIAGFGAALLVAFLLPDEGAVSPVAATAGAPASPTNATPAPPPVKVGTRSAQPRSDANPTPTAGSSAEPGLRRDAPAEATRRATVASAAAVATSCSTLSGLGHEQCAACVGQSTPQRKVCEEKVKDLYCQGRAGLDPACPEGERAQAFPSNSQH